MTAWELGTLVVTTLVAVIGVLWAILVSVWREKKERLRKYEEKEVKFYDEMRVLSNQVSEMEGRREGEKRGVELVVSAVIEDIRASRREAQQTGQQTHE
jgi:hypothetical protein